MKGQIKSLTETTGATGPRGEEGLTALVANPISNSMVPSSDTHFTQSISPTRTPVVGDKLTVVYNCTSNGLVYMLMCNIESVSLVSPNVYSCKMWMRSSYVISGDVGPKGPTGPTGPRGATGPTGNANVKTGSVTVSTRGTAATVTLGAQPKLVQIWNSSGELVSGTITRTSTGFKLTSNLTGTFTYCAVM